MHSSKTILLAAACASMLLAGCAAMFHGKPDLEIVGPPNLQVESVNGGPVQAYRDEGGLVVHPNPALTDSLRISYGNQSTVVALAKNPNALEILNIFSYGVGFAVDDLSHSWFNYAPVYITIDSSSRGVTGISASSVNWLGEKPGERDLHGLVQLGMGFSFQLNENGGIPLPIGLQRIDYPLVTFQAGLGIDYRKALELFFLIRDDPSYSITNNNGETTEISAGDLCLRYFFQKNLFVQGSFGKAYAPTYYDYETYDPLTGGYIGSSSTPSFNEVGVAIGWAGDISYISLQYFDGLTSFSTPDYTNIRYHTVYLNFGLNFRM